LPGAFRDALAHLILPVIVLALYAAATVTRQSRAALLGEAHQEYVTLARAKGARELRVLLHHMWPNTTALTVTVIALTYADLLQGAVLIETVFARPGLGRYLTTAIFAADLPALLGATLLIGSCFIIINTGADAIARLFDPRRA
jgi:peptide/nickel transport system permease protein